MTKVSHVIEVIAMRLLGRAVARIAPAGNGANNRIYRVEDSAGRPYALKIYPFQGEQGRDRLGQEAAALRFLGDCGVAGVPPVVGILAEGNAALYGWIEGERIERPENQDLDALASFLLELQGLRARPAAAGLPNASASCFSLGEVVRQAEARAREFKRCEAPLVRAYVATEWRPDFDKYAQQAQDAYRERGFDADAPLSPRLRALSPSDFGTHNVLRRNDGSLAFVDFEYFGWDDPVKAVADAILHPGTEMDAAQRRRFCQAVVPYFAQDDDCFVFRLKTLYSLYGLIWCLICLNRYLKMGASATVATDLARVRERQRRAGELLGLE